MAAVWRHLTGRVALGVSVFGPARVEGRRDGVVARRGVQAVAVYVARQRQVLGWDGVEQRGCRGGTPAIAPRRTTNFGVRELRGDSVVSGNAGSPGGTRFRTLLCLSCAAGWNVDGDGAIFRRGNGRWKSPSDEFRNRGR